jgi:hypothetical protein
VLPGTYLYCHRYLRRYHTNDMIRRAELSSPDRTQNLISTKSLFFGFVGVLSFLLIIFYIANIYQRYIFWHLNAYT